jgi:hypothetical protein
VGGKAGLDVGLHFLTEQQSDLEQWEHSGSVGLQWGPGV